VTGETPCQRANQGQQLPRSRHRRRTSPHHSSRSVQSPETFWPRYLLALESPRIPVSIPMDARTAPDAASSNSSYLVYLDRMALVWKCS